MYIIKIRYFNGECTKDEELHVVANGGEMRYKVIGEMKLFPRRSILQRTLYSQHNLAEAAEPSKRSKNLDG